MELVFVYIIYILHINRLALYKCMIINIKYFNIRPTKSGYFKKASSKANNKKYCNIKTKIIATKVTTKLDAI